VAPGFAPAKHRIAERRSSLWFLRPDWFVRWRTLQFERVNRTQGRMPMTQLSRLMQIAALLMAVAFFVVALRG